MFADAQRVKGPRTAIGRCKRRQGSRGPASLECGIEHIRSHTQIVNDKRGGAKTLQATRDLLGTPARCKHTSTVRSYRGTPSQDRLLAKQGGKPDRQPDAAGEPQPRDRHGYNNSATYRQTSRYGYRAQTWKRKSRLD
ncbi:uncharacterized protein LOC111262208 isoform X1 [Varroa jacobsoni]|uniref:uncharacterized protein LOC111262208 isoform X1 n=1 Tax=Varroa jacobsoni TaxID=62625 RepID=UPI000BF60555|nr:uncharacterized protein LOC111262208 isoform X1 [Varroa jacobsoni]